MNGPRVSLWWPGVPATVVDMSRMLIAVPLLVLGFTAGCGGNDSKSAADTGATTEKNTAKNGARFPTVVKVKATPAGSGARAYDFAVTISSPYDSEERYADGWRVKTEAGKVLGTMKLGHDHATEQPFTRDQADVAVPAGIDTVFVEGHDLKNGYGGKTATVTLP